MTDETAVLVSCQRGAALAAGLPAEDVGATVNAGAVDVLYSLGLFRDGFETGGTGDWSATLP